MIYDEVHEQIQGKAVIDISKCQQSIYFLFILHIKLNCVPNPKSWCSCTKAFSAKSEEENFGSFACLSGRQYIVLRNVSFSFGPLFNCSCFLSMRHAFINPGCPVLVMKRAGSSLCPGIDRLSMTGSGLGAMACRPLGFSLSLVPGVFSMIVTSSFSDC